MSIKNIESAENAMVVTGGFADTESMEILREALADDCQAMNFTFDKISLPTGGVTVFQLPDEDENGNSVTKDITGVILYNHPAFAFYSKEYTGERVPPDCSSIDGVTGVGVPGGDCENCPYNQYGSGEGKSKACKNKRYLYIIREGEIFPIILSLPASSLANFIKYTKQQLSKRRRLNQVVTKITLKKATSSTGMLYSQAVFTFVRVLEQNERQAIAEMTDNVKEYATKLSSDDLIETSDNATPASDTKNNTVLSVDPETGEVFNFVED